MPFIEHAYELRRRLYYIIISIVVWGAAIYGIQQHVVNALVSPAKGQHFIYTSVGGGVDFLFRICIYGGIILSLPVIVYNILGFIEPIIKHGSRRFIALGSIISGVLAITGMIFGYYIGLPAALHFLLHQFRTVQIQPLVTIQSYLHFVIIYMFGSAMLFQLPLLLIFINRIKPLKPKRLLHYERWVILAAFVLSGLMNPTPNIISQLLVAGPFIVMYQVGILIIALINRPRYPAHVQQLMERDNQARLQRQQLARSVEPVLAQASSPAITTPVLHTRSSRPRPVMSEVTPVESPPIGRHTVARPVLPRAVPPRPRQRLMDFGPMPRINRSLSAET